MNKKCSKCESIKNINEFHKCSKTKDGYKCACKKCRNKDSLDWKKRNREHNKEVSKKYYSMNKDYYKQYREENKDKISESKKDCYCKNKEYYIDKSKEYYIDNKNSISEKKKNYRNNNKEKIREMKRKYRNSPRGREFYRNKSNLRRATYKDTNITSNWLIELKENTEFCPLCGVKMNDINNHPSQYNLDHIIPLNINGTHTKDNVRFTCRHCNLIRPKDGSDLGVFV